MDIAAIRNDPNPEGRIFQEILPHTTKSVSAYGFNNILLRKIDEDTKSAIAVLLHRKTNEESGLFNGPPDALSAVKLDPAVLEAQITVNRSVKNEHTPASLTKKTKDAESQRRFDFDKAMCMQRAVLMSLSGQQLNLLTRYVNTLRMQRHATQKLLECAFCKNNGHSEIWYTTHFLKDRKGRVRCPVLRAFSCRRCGATGDHAHTIKYCPNQ